MCDNCTQLQWRLDLLPFCRNTVVWTDGRAVSLAMIWPVSDRFEVSISSAKRHWTVDK